MTAPKNGNLASTHLETACTIAIAGRRYHANGHSHYGPGLAERTERIECFKSAEEKLTDAERIELDSAAAILIDKVPGIGVLGALEILACLGMWLSKNNLCQETIVLLREEET